MRDDEAPYHAADQIAERRPDQCQDDEAEDRHEHGNPDIGEQFDEQAQRPLVISSCAAPPVAARSTLSRNAPSLFATTAQNGKVKGLG